MMSTPDRRPEQLAAACTGGDPAGTTTCSLSPQAGEDFHLIAQELSVLVLHIAQMPSGADGPLRRLAVLDDLNEFQLADLAHGLPGNDRDLFPSNGNQDAPEHARVDARRGRARSPSPERRGWRIAPRARSR